jgi:hypothetical protein
MERAIARVKKIVEGNPLAHTAMICAQASNDQLEKILSRSSCFFRSSWSSALSAARPWRLAR